MNPKKKQPDLEAEIDRNLKRVYDTVANEPLPARFTELLAQLKQGDAERSGNDGGSHDDESQG